MASWTIGVLVLTVFLCGSVPTTSGDQDRLHKWMVSRFLHGCPFAFPCALPPCDNPVFGPHDCCGSCPDPEPEIVQTTVASNPTNINTRSNVLDRRSANQRSGEFRGAARAILAARFPTMTPPPTTTEDCPWPCVMNGHHYCHPFPCHIRCVDAIMPHGSCCEVCPNGPNCHWNGHVISEGKNATFPDGTVVHCYYGDLMGGNYHVYNPVVG